MTASPILLRYLMSVNYRTATTCSTTSVYVTAASPEEASQLASDKVRKRRGVVKIDGGHLLGAGLEIAGDVR
jgi:hypothetical protein